MDGKSRVFRPEAEKKFGMKIINVNITGELS